MILAWKNFISGFSIPHFNKAPVVCLVLNNNLPGVPSK